MPISRIKTDGIQDDAITSAKIGVDVIVADDLAANSVTVSELTDGAVTSAKLDTNIAVTGTLSSGSSMTATGLFKANGGAVFNEDSTGVDFRVESLNNANMFFVDGGNDRVGIGTASPDALLQIEKSDSGTTIDKEPSSQSGPNVVIHNSNQTANNLSSVQFTNRGTNGVAEIATAGIHVKHEAQGGTYSYGSMNFNVTNSAGSYATRMHISSGGNVGIGTSSPSVRLDTRLGTTTGKVAEFHNSAGYGIGFTVESDGGVNTINSETNQALAFATNGASNERLRLDSSGNVGIGIVNPASKLQAYHSITLQARICDQSVNGHYFEAQSLDGTDAFTIYQKHGSTSSRNSFIVKDNISTGRTAFAVRSDGHVLVGTTSTTPNPGVSLQRGGTIGIGNSNGNSGTSFIEFRRNATQIGSITQNGTTGINVNTSSDYRLKENVTTDWDATTRLKQLNPVRFNFIADADTTVDGFLAHEVQDIVPEAITGEKDAVDADGNPEYQGIDQSKLVPLLVKTIQELEARITALESN